MTTTPETQTPTRSQLLLADTIVRYQSAISAMSTLFKAAHAAEALGLRGTDLPGPRLWLEMTREQGQRIQQWRHVYLPGQWQPTQAHHTTVQAWYETHGPDGVVAYVRKFVTEHETDIDKLRAELGIEDQ